MDENSGAAVLITHSSSSAASSSPVLGSRSQRRQQEAKEAPRHFQLRQADDSLIQVIEKLSKIVEKQPHRRGTLGGQKRVLHVATSAGGGAVEEASACKKVKRHCPEEARKAGGHDGALSSPASGDDSNNNSVATGGAQRRTVTCYQCSLCPFLSQTLPQLKEHLKQHNEQHSDLILMCSECHFASRDQAQLEAHVRLHFDEGGDTRGSSAPSDLEGKEDVDGGRSRLHGEGVQGSVESSRKSWYKFEEYGLYRCLICSYVCTQQRMLKTHAWKHAGLVDCSYPIFEEEDGGSAKKEVQVPANSVAPREDIVVLSPVLQDQSLQKLPFKLQLCVPLTVENKEDTLNLTVPGLSQSPKAAKGEEDSEYPKDMGSEEPAVEVQVTTEAEAELELDGRRGGSSVPDSLLSSAQKIINSSPNSVGHINVIVERLPSAEDSLLVTKPLLLGPDMDRDKGLLAAKQGEQDYAADVAADSQPAGGDVKPPGIKSSDSSRDENIPPAGRKRTHSESLRLHSLAAEALVAMPMRMPELPASGAKVNLTPCAGHKLLEAGKKASDKGSAAALLNLELGSEEDLCPLAGGDDESPSTKAGISMSLLTVIERLRERSDQNASDEDILKELRDNAQFQRSGLAGVVAENGAEGYMCSIPGGDGLPPDGGLVDYVPGSERPYRCRLCRYSSCNKGYIKQHLRVHKQRPPYQCPICEHKASNSKDLENHMIHHCKTRTYQCKQCPDSFYYKSQLRSHEREHLSVGGDVPALTAVAEAVASVEDADMGTDEEGNAQKMFKCDVCNYTSSTYVGVRNHRRIHNSDKPYRCCSCDFATTNMNSLKSHMRRHPQGHQAVQLLEQYRCSLCGYVCSHPPSLKSHMWKHAGDQNYNYEQVNKAINEAISQSSRAPHKLAAVVESVAEGPAGAAPLKEKVKLEPPSPLPSAAKTDGASGVPALPADSSQCPQEAPPPQQKDPEQSKSCPCAGQPPPTPSMEYCVLLFCCCICGFESTSKERLMEHMKEHEGAIISIILNKEQQQAETQASLQRAQ
ncbi:zinc finger protein 507 [Oryzias latipes]|uniref:Zinc finger protein 507 n=1 Tax=Oryzias latipes TaxID=8090 RepID=H2MKZ3_ORYLA|nr:zinc finger protein 507 [Oryzias latipes]